jgi:hypothetical protein
MTSRPTKSGDAGQLHADHETEVQPRAGGEALLRRVTIGLITL